MHRSLAQSHVFASASLHFATYQILVTATMTRRRRNGPHAPKGTPGRSRIERERRALIRKQVDLRLAVHAVQQSASGAKEKDADDCFRFVRELALSPLGLVTDEFRQTLWPFLLGQWKASLSLEMADPAADDAHRDDGQVEKDIDRSLWWAIACDG